MSRTDADQGLAAEGVAIAYGRSLIVEGLANVTEGSPVDAHAVPGDDTDAAQ